MMHRKFGAILIITLVALGASDALAEYRGQAFTASPMIGGYIFESEQGLQQHNFTVNAKLGYTLTKHLGIEGSFNYIYTRAETGHGTVNGYLYGLDALYHFNTPGKLVPYFAAGFGGISMQPAKGGSRTDALFDYGAGIQYFVTENVALRGDIRHILNLGEGESNFMYMGGVTFYVGGAQAKDGGE